MISPAHVHLSRVIPTIPQRHYQLGPTREVIYRLVAEARLGNSETSSTRCRRILEAGKLDDQRLLNTEMQRVLFRRTCSRKDGDMCNSLLESLDFTRS